MVKTMWDSFKRKIRNVTNSELIDSNLVPFIRCSKFISAHLFKGIKERCFHGHRYRVHSAGGSGYDLLLRKHSGGSQSFTILYTRKQTSFLSRCLCLTEPTDVFHHSAPERQELRFNLVEPSLLTFGINVTFNKDHRRSFYSKHRNPFDCLRAPGGNIPPLQIKHPLS